MPRNTIEDAIVLKSSRFAEYHKKLFLLTKGSGMIDAIAYGAFKSKSKLAGITESCVRLRGYLYFEPVRGQYKLTDAEPIATYDGIRVDLKKFYSASLLSELVMVSYAGGDEHAQLHPLIANLFARLSECEIDQTNRILIQGIARFLDIIGYPPIVDECGQCGRTPIPRAFVSPGGVVLCDGCRSSESVPVTPGAISYLAHTASLSVDDALIVALDTASTAGLRRALIRLAQNVVETPLRTLKSAGGVI